MNTPTHQEIEQHAYQLWQEQGCPDGRAEEIWLQAEQDLNVKAGASSDEPVAPGGHPPSMIAAEETAQSQREAARSPDVPNKGTAPRAKPAPTGKPVWPQSR